MANQHAENIRAKDNLKILLVILLVITGINKHASGQYTGIIDTTNVVRIDSLKNLGTLGIIDSTHIVRIDSLKNLGTLIDTIALENNEEINQLRKIAKKVSNDTLLLKKDLPPHSPRKATIYAAILPGLGQLYNKNYFKAPLVYIGFGTLGYFINWNNNEYVKYRQAYVDISDDDPSSKSYEKLGLEGKWDLTNPSHISMLTTRLERAKDYSRRNRDLCIIGTIAFYGISIIEATVSAHFFDFDISEDLSFNWAIQPMFYMDQTLIGINCVINIK